MNEKQKRQLIEELQSGNARKRRSASYKLSKMIDDDVVNALINATTDSDDIVRRNAMDGLRGANNLDAINYIQSDKYQNTIRNKECPVCRTMNMEKAKECEVCGCNIIPMKYKVIAWDPKVMIPKECSSCGTTEALIEDHILGMQFQGRGSSSKTVTIKWPILLCAECRKTRLEILNIVTKSAPSIGSCLLALFGLLIPIIALIIVSSVKLPPDSDSPICAFAIIISLTLLFLTYMRSTVKDEDKNKHLLRNYGEVIKKSKKEYQHIDIDSDNEEFILSIYNHNYAAKLYAMNSHLMTEK
jgi:hypothetical protein